MENGYTKEEMKMVWETNKIMGDANIKVNPTTARVPVFFGHSEAVHIETGKKITAPRRASCCPKRRREVVDDRKPGVTPPPSPKPPTMMRSTLAAFARIFPTRASRSVVVSDNVRKGAALNSVQIAEILVKEYI